MLCSLLSMRHLILASVFVGFVWLTWVCRDSTQTCVQQYLLAGRISVRSQPGKSDLQVSPCKAMRLHHLEEQTAPSKMFYNGKPSDLQPQALRAEINNLPGMHNQVQMS